MHLYGRRSLFAGGHIMWVLLACGSAIYPTKTAGAQVNPPVPLPNQTPLPTLTVNTRWEKEVANLQLVVPAGAVPDGGRARVALWEAGGALVAEKAVRFGVEGQQSTLSLKLRADAGRYEVGLLSQDKARRPLSARAAWRVPGLRREAGTWWLEGTVFLREAVPGTALSPARFIPNLRRDAKVQLPLSWRNEGDEALSWRTVDLPPLATLAAQNYDWAALETSLTQRLKQRGGWYVGFVLPARDGVANETELAGKAVATFARLRQVLDRVAPGAAVILSVAADQDPERVSRDLLATAHLADALLLQYSGTGGELWPLKVARRIVEEQPSYDLPLLVRAPRATADFELKCLMSGATGLVVAPDYQGSPESFYLANLTYLAGAVTLEDAALFPAGTAPLLPLVKALRSGGRLPLLGKVSADGKGPAESMLAVLDNSTDEATLEAQKSTAARGATLYLEGVPNLTQPRLLSLMEDMSGTRVELLPRPVGNQLDLEDVWTFGSARSRELPVSQKVRLTLRSSLAAQTKNERGVDKLTAPRWVARLADDRGGIVVYPVGKGRIFWNPHALQENASPAGLADFYAALAGAMQSSLITFKGKPDQAAPTPEVALRQSAGKTALVGVWNPRGEPMESTAVFRGTPELAIDLKSGEKLAVSSRGYHTSLPVKLEPRSWTIIALAENQAALDKELSTPRLKARFQ